MLFFCAFTKLCMRSQKWDRQAVPFLGPCLGSFLHFFFGSGLKKRNVLVSAETLWLMATRKATREALLSEAGFEKVFRTQNWVRRSQLFCRWFCSLLGLIESGGSWLLIIWFRLVAWLFAAKRRLHLLFPALGDCLRCSLLLRSWRVFAQVAGFQLDDCIEYFTAPCWPPLPL